MRTNEDADDGERRPQQERQMVVQRFCECGHSDGAHQQRQGRCGLCNCSAFRLDRVVGGPSDSARANDRTAAQPSDEGRVSLSEAAYRLGVSLATLRKYAQAGKFPAEKVHGAWSVLEADVQRWEQQFQHIPRSGKARARLSEFLAFEDEQRRLNHQGPVTSPRLPAGDSFVDRARRAAAEAIEHQLHPEMPRDGTPPLPLSRSRKGRAQMAEREALDDMLRKPGQSHPPERSL